MNPSESVFGETERSMRQCVLIKSISEVDMGTSEHAAITACDILKARVDSSAVASS